MKNSLKKLFCLFLVATFLGIPVYADTYHSATFSELPLLDLPGFTTTLVDKDEDTHSFSGVLDISAFGQTPLVDLVVSYAIYNPDGEEILSVELCNISSNTLPLLSGSATAKPATNGYYATEFLLSKAENTYAYLTGLTQTKIETIQEKILEKVLAGEDFRIEDVDFIDTEKTSADENDDDLCWAASTANMLHYAEWGKYANAEKFRDEDDLFEYFIESFEDDGGHQFYGLEWFFSGVYSGPGGCTKPQNGGLLPYYDPNLVAKQLSVKYIPGKNNFDNMLKVINALRHGYAVGTGVEWGLNSNLGHAITTWGYIFDRNIHVTDPSHYLALLISDSDSDKGGADRGASPDVLHAHYMTPCFSGSTFITWKFSNYRSNNQTGYLTDFTLLKPYSDNLPKETSADATKSPATTADLFMDSLSLSTRTNLKSSATTYFLTSENVWIDPIFYNFGYASHESSYSLSVSITDNKGISFHNLKTDPDNTPLHPDDGYGFSINFAPLPAGSYTATVTVETAGKEAYYYNNSLSIDFQVIDASTPCLVKYDDVRQTIYTYLPARYAENPQLLIASHNANDTLTFNKSVSLEEGKQSVLITQPQGDTNRAMLWDFSNLKPLCDPLSLN